MKKHKLLVWVLIVWLVTPVYSAGPAIDFDGKNKEAAFETYLLENNLSGEIPAARSVLELTKSPKNGSPEEDSWFVLVTKELPNMGLYVSYPGNTREFQTFDFTSAIKAGLSNDAVQLMKEIVAFQNEMYKIANLSKIKDVTKIDPLPQSNYPRLKKYWEIASRRVKEKKKVHLRGLGEPCGTYEYPVPNCNPIRHSYASYNPRQSLLNMGFHETDRYACGNYEGCISDEHPELGWVDFTLPSEHSSEQGYCAYPRFRDQGRIRSQTEYSIQYGEPNPEIFSFTPWPYDDWGAYVIWWHLEFSDYVATCPW